MLDISTKRTEGALMVSLKGRLDANTAAELGAVLADLDTSLVLDLRELQYISSAGLRVLLSAKKQTDRIKKDMALRNVPRDIMDVLETTGFSQIITIEKQLREVSVEGCLLLGKGVTGECYRLSEDTVLKLYNEGMDDSLIEREKRYARAAFVAGLPTAISFDIVRCGNRKGVLYELIDAKTLSALIIGEPDRLEDYAVMFSDLCKCIHETPGDSSEYPDCKALYRADVEALTVFSDEEKRTLFRIIDRIPDCATCIHGDLHTSNIFIQKGEPLLIDMGDLSVGHPFFDLAQPYNLFYWGQVNQVWKRATGIPPETGRRFWALFEEAYFGVTADEDRFRIREILETFRAFKQVHFMTYLDRADFRREIVQRRLLDIPVDEVPLP